MKSISARRGIEGEIATLRTREQGLIKKMRDLSKKLKRHGFIDHSYRIDEYVELNKSLKETKIQEAELVYIRNIL